jgi:hypothetical protein
MEDSSPLSDNVFQLTSSPLVCTQAELRAKLFNNYLVAPNTLSADISRYLLFQLAAISSSDQIDPLLLDRSRERLSWLAAADVKYFIIPDASPLGGAEEAKQNDEQDAVSSSSSSAITRKAEINNFIDDEDEDEI